MNSNYKLAIHMHFLDWYGSDNSPRTLNAHMRYMGWDICAISIKDIAPYHGKSDVQNIPTILNLKA